MATERIVSPGVFTRENDLSFLPTGISQIGAAIVGPTEQGPAFIPKIVTSQAEYEQIFGTPTDFYTGYAAQNYLRESATLTVVRVAGLDGYEMGGGLLVEAVSGSVKQVVAVLAPSASLNGLTPFSTTSVDLGNGQFTLLANTGLTPVAKGGTVSFPSTATAIVTTTFGATTVGVGTPLVISGTGSITVSAGGAYTFAPVLGYSGSFDITNSFDSGDSKEHTVGGIYTAAPSSQTFTLLIPPNDITHFDINGGTQTVTAGGTGTLTAVGSLTISAGGGYIFTPVAGFSGSIAGLTRWDNSHTGSFEVWGQYEGGGNTGSVGFYPAATSVIQLKKGGVSGSSTITIAGTGSVTIENNSPTDYSWSFAPVLGYSGATFVVTASFNTQLNPTQPLTASLFISGGYEAVGTTILAPFTGSRPEKITQFFYNGLIFSESILAGNPVTDPTGAFTIDDNGNWIFYPNATYTGNVEFEYYNNAAPVTGSSGILSFNIPVAGLPVTSSSVTLASVNEQIQTFTFYSSASVSASLNADEAGKGIFTIDTTGTGSFLPLSSFGGPIDYSFTTNFETYTVTGVAVTLSGSALHTTSSVAYPGIPAVVTSFDVPSAGLIGIGASTLPTPMPGTGSIYIDTNGDIVLGVTDPTFIGTVSYTAYFNTNQWATGSITATITGSQTWPGIVTAPPTVTGISSFTAGAYTGAAGTTGSVAGVGQISVATNGQAHLIPLATFSGSVPVSVVWSNNQTGSNLLTYNASAFNGPTTTGITPIPLPSQATAVVTYSVSGALNIPAGTTTTVPGYGDILVNSNGTWVFTPISTYFGSLGVTASFDSELSPGVPDTTKFNANGATDYTTTAVASASIYTSSPNTIDDVFGMNPFFGKAAYAYSFFDVTETGNPLAGANPAHIQLKFSQIDGISGGSSEQNFGYEANYASTPWIKSQTYNGTRYNLFKIHTLADGQSENQRFKIQISQVKSSDGTAFGTFNITLRDYNDTDRNKSILETYSGVNLDPASSNYIGRRIGTIDTTINSEGKIIETGDFQNKSKLIRVEVATEGTYPLTAVPFANDPYELPVDLGVSGSAFPIVKYTNASSGSSTRASGFDFGSDNNVNYLAPLPDISHSNIGANKVFALDGSGSNAVTNEYNVGLPSGVVTAEQQNYRTFVVAFQGGFDGLNPTTVKLKGGDITETNTQGLDCSTSSAEGSRAYVKALTAISNADEFDINMIATPGIIRSYHPYVTTKVIDLCEGREDAFYIADFTGLNQSINDVVEQAASVDTNYAGTYYPWIKTIDTLSNRIISIPPSVLLPGTFAQNDRLGAEWFAPAGLNRGGINGAIQVATRLTHGERDTLYEGKVNPIAIFPGQGISAFGQKTLQEKASALDRINVRRLLINLKKFVASTSRFLVFEQNTAQTRQRFLNTVNPYLESVQQRQGLYAFRVVMDETNNTPDTIDRNILVGDIYLQPTKTAEFIIVSFNVLPTGATFSA